MVTITLYTRQQKRHWCVEQSIGLCGRGRGWDDLGEWHWNMYNIIYETSLQSRFDAGYWMLGAGALGWPRGMVWGGRREEGSGWGTHVCLWRIHFDIWQNQYNIVKFKNKIKLKKKKDYWSGLSFPSPMHECEKSKWSCSVVSDSSWPHGLKPTNQAPVSMGFSRQEYWSGVPSPSLFELVVVHKKEKYLNDEHRI